jgi:uncharacterized membrane protein (UPF0127 family)
MSLPALSLNAWLRYDVVARLLEGLDVRSVLEIGAGEAARRGLSVGDRLSVD